MKTYFAVIKKNYQAFFSQVWVFFKNQIAVKLKLFLLITNFLEI